MTERDDFFQGEQYFSFVCPEGREGEARLLLGSIRNVSLFDGTSGITRVAPNEAGKYVEVSGIEISGQCFDEGCEEAVNVLARNEIAGFSRETQIVFIDPQSQNIGQTILRIDPGEF